MRFLFIASTFLLSLHSLGQTTISLYPGKIPNTKQHTKKEVKTYEGIVDTILRQVTHPTLTLFKAASNKSGASVIVIPGGGYGAQLITREGERLAKAFNKIGVTAFVLKYRLPDDAAMVDKKIAPLQDLQQAIKLVREKADQWNIAPDKIGIMGFSAGGHLAAMGGVHFDTAFIENMGTSLRPDYMFLINPVISFMDIFGHIGSRTNLAGEDITESTKRFFSGELNVTAQTPPAILIHCNDDTVVPVENSLAFYKRLTEEKIPAALHIYTKGEHGFLQEPSLDEWFGRCVFWMQQMKIISVD